MPLHEVATELFADLRMDADFVREYNGARARFLEHHRAHERVGQGRGVKAATLKECLVEIDRRRGVGITYV